MEKLKICEIFKSIQGESTFVGKPCIFIRLVGCNLRCNYCDTTYAYEGGNELSIEAILAQVRTLNCSLVEITGGEPLLQAEVLPLITALHQENYTILMETNGSLPLPPRPRFFRAIMDVKCPGSGESQHHYYENFRQLQKGDEIKFVVSSTEDIEWAFDLIRSYDLTNHAEVLLSPVFNRMPFQLLAQKVADSGLNIRMQLQLHKLIWDPQTQGV